MPHSCWIWFESTCLFYFLNCVTQTTSKVLATIQATRIPGQEGYFYRVVIEMEYVARMGLKINIEYDRKT